ncbi:type II secretion system F family protein [Ammoniphilus sp. CFH 90114]|uniref:type II secretion system F family protein n=1 Tax=Ammoniphilus sp. CFH 90114 TaxID=2493665 RepID=UPI00100ECC46|nr:type II secretion system F family protein [Ammoniphilus sp. CFH 90114]RXT14692.1 type II secretion system F family protein [Ammoniphilus sp. CFH 90114]
MTQFVYEGRDRTGKQRKGKITSNSRREAMLKLREQGIAVLNMKEQEVSFLQQDITIGSPVKFKDYVIFLRQYSTLLQSGVTVVDATKVLAEQSESKALRSALQGIEEDLRSGKPLSEAASKHPKIFPPMFINMVQAGEVAGSIDETLDRLATYFEKQHRTKQKVVSALTYPIVVGLIAGGVVMFLLTSVVPTFANMFSGFGAELPAITKLVLHLSARMKEIWWMVILGLILLYVTFMIIKRMAGIKFYVDYFSLRLPLFGKLLQKALIARMARTLSSLFASSVPILQAITIVEKVLDNEVMTKVLSSSRTSLETGRPLTEPMKQHWVFPPLVTQMIAIGEQTGSLDVMLGKVADFYEAEVESATDQLKSLIEPLMIVLLAGIVGTIVSAILVPMFQIFNEIKL